MNGFKHVAAPHLLGGHYWTFDPVKYRRILAECGDNTDLAKTVCYTLHDEGIWIEDRGELKAFIAQVAEGEHHAQD